MLDSRILDFFLQFVLPNFSLEQIFSQEIKIPPLVRQAATV